MYRRFKSFIARSFYQGVQIENHTILAVAILGPFCHIFLYAFHKYIMKVEYESLAIRLLISCICALVYFYKFLPHKFRQKYFPAYWYFVMISALPMQCTFFLLKNGFNEIFLYWGIFCLIVISVFIANWFMVVVSVVIANILAIYAYYLSTSFDNILELDFSKVNFTGYAIVYIFCAIFGMLFIWVNKKTWLLKEERYLKSMAGSIAHEIRNPLNTINIINNQINEILQDIEQDLRGSVFKKTEDEMISSINEAKEQNETLNNKPKK